MKKSILKLSTSAIKNTQTIKGGNNHDNDKSDWQQWDWNDSAPAW